jgi:hypothetical protein
MQMLEVSARSVQSQPAPSQWTYEDYLTLPDDGHRYEIIEGVNSSS